MAIMGDYSSVWLGTVQEHTAQQMDAAAADLDLFDALTDGALTATEIARRLRCDLRGLVILLDALAALRLRAAGESLLFARFAGGELPLVPLGEPNRPEVEAAMAAGKLRAVVATSSLDLGIDWGDVDLVVLVDTSASQTGDHRGRALEAVRGLLEKARPSDRFRIAAVDVTCSVPTPRKVRSCARVTSCQASVFPE